ncbi:cob(I)yrinic acid a,c-diamide adenosyltransferase [Candidatus Nomurabacteria bacterium]|nr:cob(I)yrinic acid a,c-diamide adenosyltransferase [Candidatus Nomurabacteria bacterium]
MKIYTKQGDAGETSLYGGERVAKDHLRIKVYGTLDELNATLGVVLAQNNVQNELKTKVFRIQNELFELGSELATPTGKKINFLVLSEENVLCLEKEIDEMETALIPLKNFILPGGSRLSSFLHLARAISRRAERELIALHRTEPVRSIILQYVNRLSDHLFVLARFANHLAKINDVAWKK